MTREYFSALAALRSEIPDHESGQWCRDDCLVELLLYFLRMLSEEARIATVGKRSFQAKDKITVLQKKMDLFLLLSENSNAMLVSK